MCRRSAPAAVGLWAASVPNDRTWWPDEGSKVIGQAEQRADVATTSCRSVQAPPTRRPPAAISGAESGPQADRRRADRRHSCNADRRHSSIEPSLGLHRSGGRGSRGGGGLVSAAGPAAAVEAGLYRTTGRGGRRRARRWLARRNSGPTWRPRPVVRYAGHPPAAIAGAESGPQADRRRADRQHAAMEPSLGLHRSGGRGSRGGVGVGECCGSGRGSWGGVVPNDRQWWPDEGSEVIGQAAQRADVATTSCRSVRRSPPAAISGADLGRGIGHAGGSAASGPPALMQCGPSALINGAVGWVCTGPAGVVRVGEWGLVSAAGPDAAVGAGLYRTTGRGGRTRARRWLAKRNSGPTWRLRPVVRYAGRPPAAISGADLGRGIGPAGGSAPTGPAKQVMGQIAGRMGRSACRWWQLTAGGSGRPASWIDEGAGAARDAGCCWRGRTASTHQWSCRLGVQAPAGVVRVGEWRLVSGARPRRLTLTKVEVAGLAGESRDEME